ncbi:MAG: hypothetical protein DMF65_00585 [Acidobacteria bacterium]|nr:MAG: hypothetical protein DMF65_00585 [Acidobacteriota bacterium]
MNANDEQAEREARRMLIVKRVLEVLGWLTAVALLAFASHAVFAADGGRSRRATLHGVAFNGYTPTAQDAQDEPTVRRQRERTTREREDLSPASIIREARTIYVAPTEHLDRKYLEYKLQKYDELRDWDLSLVENPSAADLVINVDKTALNYIFTVTDPRTSVVVTSGKCVAVNGRVAAEFLGREIIKKIRDVRASSTPRRHRKHSRDREDDDESES